MALAPGGDEEGGTLVLIQPQCGRQPPDRLRAWGGALAALQVRDAAHTQPRRFGQLLLGEAGAQAVAAQEVGEGEGLATRAHGAPLPRARERDALAGAWRPL